MSETPIVKVSCDVEPSEDDAVTMTSMEPSVSASNDAPAATETVPSSATSNRLSSTVKETVSEASLSAAEAVMPTVAPSIAFSAMVLAPPSVSVTFETAVSFTSETSIVKVSCDEEPSLDVAVTVTSMEPSVSVSKEAPAATVTVPSSATSNRLSSTEYVTVSLSFSSVALTMIPTAAPVPAVSATEFDASFVSVTAPISRATRSLAGISPSEKRKFSTFRTVSTPSGEPSRVSVTVKLPSGFSSTS